MSTEPGLLRFKHTTIDLQRLSRQEKATLDKSLVTAVQYLRKIEAAVQAKQQDEPPASV